MSEPRITIFRPDGSRWQAVEAIRRLGPTAYGGTAGQRTTADEVLNGARRDRRRSRRVERRLGGLVNLEG